MAAKNFLPKSDLSVSTLSVTRLKNRADFLNCRNGARSHERAFVLQAAKRKTDPVGTSPQELRVGFTVTKKIGNAVERNRIKRRFRAALSQSNLSADCGGMDAVMIARRSALDVPFDTLVQDIGNSFAKLCKGDVANHGRAGQKHRDGT